ncbi:MAG TPA: hypothetical protein DEA50_09335 [Parvularcula sp.]|nr:hypothetical protein [Parvularcula sp.]
MSLNSPSGARASASKASRRRKRNLDQIVGYQLQRTGSLVTRELAVVFSAVGLAPGQFSILLIIAENPGCTQSQIAVLARLDPSTLALVIARLRVLGFIRRAADAGDRRSNRIHSTEKGEQAIRSVLPILARFESRITGEFSATEKQAFLRCLSKIERAIVG